MRTARGCRAGQVPQDRGIALRRMPVPLLTLLLLAATLLAALSSIAGGARPQHPITAGAGTVIATGGATPVLTTLSGPGADGDGPRAHTRGVLDDERLGWRPGSPAEAGARQGRGQPLAPLLAVLFLLPVAALPWLRPGRTDDPAAVGGRDAVRHPSRGPPPAVA